MELPPTRPDPPAAGPAPSPEPGAAVRLLAALAATTLALAFAWFSLKPLVRGGDDFGGYVWVGRQVLESGDPYLEVRPYYNPWPPPFALLAVPLALAAGVAPGPVRAGWQLASLLALFLALRLIRRLLTGPCPAGPPGPPGLPPAPAPLLLPLLLAFKAIAENQSSMQINLLLFALVLYGLAWQAEGSPGWGGLALGLAAAIKLMPIAFLPYLVWRRRLPAARAMAATLAGLGLLPVLLVGPARAAAWYGRWFEVLGRGWAVSRVNQSLVALWDRFLGHGVVPFASDPEPILLATGSPWVKAAVFVTRLLVAGLALRTFKGPMAPASPRALAEWSVVFLVAACFGPVAWRSYFVVALLPWCLLAWVASRPEVDAPTRRGASLLLAITAALSLFSARELVGRYVSIHLELASTHTWSALVLVAGLFWLHPRLPAGD